MAQTLADRTRAVLIAEAGAAQAYAVLAADFNQRTNPAAFTPFAYGGGMCTLKVVPFDSNGATIIATGMCGRVQEYVMLDVRNYGPYVSSRTGGTTNGLSTNAFDYAICAGGTLSWAGNSDITLSNAWLHCNSAYNANGANKVKGNVSSSVGISLCGNAEITGTGVAPSISGNVGNPIIMPVPLVPIPNIDLTPYYLAALANNQVFNGNRSLSGNVAPTGGIMWVNGNVYFGNGTYTGCFIATGDIQIKTTGQGTVTFNKVANYPILVSRDGDITVKQAKTMTFNGLIYAKTGGFYKQGSGDVIGRGSIVVAGGFNKVGEWSGMLYEDSTPVPPGISGPAESYIVAVSAWQR